jgi:hypothetical protein
MITPEIVIILIGIILAIVLGLFNMSREDNNTEKDERNQHLCPENFRGIMDIKDDIQANIFSNCSTIQTTEMIINHIPNDTNKLSFLEFMKLVHKENVKNDSVDERLRIKPNLHLYIYVLVNKHNITKEQLSHVLHSLDVRNNTDNFKGSLYIKLITLIDVDTFNKNIDIVINNTDWYSPPNQ